MNRTDVLLLFFWLISCYCPAAKGSKINQKIFVDVDAINFADPQKHGFLIILNEQFVKNHLQSGQFPTLFVTAVPLSRNHDAREVSLGGAGDGRVSKILYPEIIQEGKLIKLDDLRERTWYYVCVEFENMNRHNETTGATCKIFRTMDKFGLPAESTLVDVRQDAASETRLQFKVRAEVDFPIKITAYLTDGGEAKVFVLKNDVTFNVTFRDLAPGTDYGRLCFIEEPQLTTYTVMGRMVRASVERCYFDSLTTAKVEHLQMATAQPQIRLRERNHEFDRTKKSPTSGHSSLRTFAYSVTVTAIVIPLLLRL